MSCSGFISVMVQDGYSVALISVLKTPDVTELKLICMRGDTNEGLLVSRDALSQLIKLWIWASFFNLINNLRLA